MCHPAALLHLCLPASCPSMQIWLAAGAIMLCVFWVVYWVASRPKNILDGDEGGRAAQDALEQLMATQADKAATGSPQ